MTAKELMDEYDKSGYCEGGTFGSFYYEDDIIEIMLERFANNKTKELQAQILDFRNKLKLTVDVSLGGTIVMKSNDGNYYDIVGIYDKHFNITTERNEK